MSGGEGLPGIGAPGARRRGRPPGSTNRRQADLARYIEAQFGATPGEQMAKVALVSKRELKAAGGDLVLAMVEKAKVLARAIGCDTVDAWGMMARERAELMAYVHQKKPQAVAVKAEGFAPAVIIVGSEGPSQLAPLEDDIDVEFQVVSSPLPAEVSRPKSHGSEFPLLDQPVSPGDAAPEE